MANVQVTFDQMRTAGTGLLHGRQQITDVLTALRQQVSDLVSGGFVTDQASVRFDEASQKFNAGAQQMMSGLDELARYLDQAASTLEDADRRLAAQLQS